MPPLNKLKEFKRGLPAALADDSSELSGEMRELLCEMSQWLRTLEQRGGRDDAAFLSSLSRQRGAAVAESDRL